MPLKKVRKGAGKKSIQKAVSYNIAELTRANKSKPSAEKRSRSQIAAIAYSAAGEKRKKK